MENSASSKAKYDVQTILQNHGYQLLEANYHGKPDIILTADIRWHHLLSKIKKNEHSIIVFQYPMYSRWLLDSFNRQVKKIRDRVTVLALVHDVEGLRLNSNNQDRISAEIGRLNRFDGLVVHNNSMGSKLTEMGLNIPTANINIFDYLESEPIHSHINENGLIIAGNLEKSTFIQDWNCQTVLNAYGVNPSDNYPTVVHYHGAFAPENLAAHLQGKYGLIWDGDSVETCGGVYGEYLRVNNPHKASLFITLGIPVVVWKDAAIAPFLVSQGVAVVVESIAAIDSALAEVDDEQYANMQQQAELLANKLRSGFFTLHAINKLI